MIDISTVESKLGSFISNEERKVEDKKETLTPLQQKMDYLSEEYPRLFMIILESFDMTDRIEQYMSKCKEYEDDPYRYSLYVHGYFLVWLDQ